MEGANIRLCMACARYLGVPSNDVAALVSYLTIHVSQL
jgi:hypothetical protein